MNKNKCLIISAALLVLIQISAFGIETELPQTRYQLSLDVTVKKNFFGIPEGVSNKGYEVWIDFDNMRCVKSDFGSPSPSGWDMVFTYVINTVSMGPMGKHPIPFYAIKINDAAGAGFYMEKGNFIELSCASVSMARGNGWTGYGHRQQNDNGKLEKEEYKLSWPYFSYDWYEMIKMTDFKYKAYPDRIFIILTTEGNAVKIQFTEVSGLGSSTLFRTEFRYDSIPVKK
jgi:hypothetical protein